MRFLVLNQYGPPDPAPTARLLGELAGELRAAGHSLEILSQKQSYQGRPARGGRLKRELQASWAILQAGWKPPGGRPDVVLSLSSPPGLPAVGALLAWRHGARLAHWAMDLYPELALALGKIRRRSPVAWIVQMVMRWAYRRAALVVALDQDMQSYLQPFCRTPVRVMEPWPARQIEQQADSTMTQRGGAGPTPSGPWVWLYSGNLGRAHEWQTLLDAQAILEGRKLPVQLVFQGDGAARASAMAYAARIGLRQCAWKGYVPEEALLPTLLGARVLIVTQRPETRGFLWPSKLALLERLPRPVLFIGPEEGAIAERLRERGNVGVFAPGRAEAVARWIEDVCQGRTIWDAGKARPLPTFAERSGLLRSWLLDCGNSSSVRR